MGRIRKLRLACTRLGDSGVAAIVDAAAAVASGSGMCGGNLMELCLNESNIDPTWGGTKDRRIIGTFAPASLSRPGVQSYRRDRGYSRVHDFAAESRCQPMQAGPGWGRDLSVVLR